MRSATYKHTLSWGWDDIKVLDWNNSEVHYKGATIFFSSAITIRGKEGEAEIVISTDLSPMSVEWASNNWFPYEVKWTWDLFILTIN